MKDAKTLLQEEEELILRQAVLAQMDNPVEEGYISLPEGINSAEGFSAWIKSI